MKGGHFPIANHWDADLRRQVRVQTATCRCGASETIRDNGAKPLAASAMAEAFRRRGWEIASHPSGDRCPACVARRKAPKASEAPAGALVCSWPTVVEQALFPAFAASPAETVEVDLMSLAAEPPRQPAREDRRRIIEALDEHYLVEDLCYAKSFSDRAVAEKLGVPPAWVAEERERAFGPNLNQVDTQKQAEIAALTPRLLALESEILALTETASALKRDIDALTSSAGRAAA